MEDDNWTIKTYAAHNEAMRCAEGKFQDERDKRYTEGNELRAMALRIKENADANALELAREAQIYKDERNDVQREQNLKQTGIYATRDDLAQAMDRVEKIIRPVVDYINNQKGGVIAVTGGTRKIFTEIALVCSLIGTIFLLVNNMR